MIDRRSLFTGLAALAIAPPLPNFAPSRRGWPIYDVSFLGNSLIGGEYLVSYRGALWRAVPDAGL